MSKIVSQHVACPNCPSTDAYCLYDDGHGYCFSCEGYTRGEETEIGFTYEFLPRRGINLGTLQKYRTKTKVDKDGKPVSVGYQYPNGSFKVRQLDKKDFYSVGKIADAGLFGRDLFDVGSHKYLTITEGEEDAQSLYQVLRSPVVSAQSAATAARDCIVDRSWINSFERVYLAFDNDVPGKRAAQEVAKLFDYNKIYHVKFNKYKDANDYLQAGEEAELKQIWWNSKKYIPDNIVTSFAEFEEILTECPRYGVNYPFKKLNEMTYGIRTGESVLITAQEGIGKTELMHFIEHSLLKETTDAVGAIFLEEPKKRHLQAIAGITLRKPVHLPDCDCTEGEVLSAIKETLREDDRLHIYSHFGSDDPEVILDTVRFLVSSRNCRYILFDHITMAVTGLAGEDERTALDHLSTRLEMMVKELDFGLILVSHVNDQGQTRGSRFISKVADIRIDLKRDVLAVDPVERNTTYMTISKNRYSGKTGPAGCIHFDPLSYSYTEIGNEQAR